MPVAAVVQAAASGMVLALVLCTLAPLEGRAAGRPAEATNTVAATTGAAKKAGAATTAGLTTAEDTAGGAAAAAKKTVTSAPQAGATPVGVSTTV